MEVGRAQVAVVLGQRPCGGIGEVLFFTVFDPQELYLFGEPSSLSRMGVYTIGFFLCWAFAAASSAFTCYLQRSAREINR